MKLEYVIYSMLLALVTMNAGCVRVDGGMPRLRVFSEPQRTLTAALDELQAGKEPQARTLMEKVVAGEPMVGVTDEALFRLALLNLNEGGKNQRAQALLERLSGEYPDSLWTKQSAPLLAHLAEVRNLHIRQRELKSLKEQNLSLSRDNKELRQSLERLKQLDLELEQKIKR